VTLGARLGIGAAAVVLLVVASGLVFLWKRPLSVSTEPADPVTTVLLKGVPREGIAHWMQVLAPEAWRRVTEAAETPSAVESNAATAVTSPKTRRKIWIPW